jgi:hypothetical protein
MVLCFIVALDRMDFLRSINDPTTQRPNDPTTQRPNDPTTQRPNDTPVFIIQYPDLALSIFQPGVAVSVPGSSVTISVGSLSSRIWSMETR